ncbi:HIT domain-containing protein [Ferrimonas balearica]|uniref:HIT domain-containing protein n=1 Tax=Ferrimonas balearica TaxID=44012 RepID=UPI001C99A47E|nr:HIT domain-containing protein [Ferrimonas balearica]MBY5921780.1 HIT domain-containing protein [Ferrimonas balearica]MBY5994880.1 HIT domain-containing protein [Ferrimonas balearica]
MFTLHPRLDADTLLLGTLPLCEVRLHRDSRYPWLLLIPMRAELTEIHHLNEADQAQLMRESCQLANLMEKTLDPDSMNIAALGNVVPQLHVHHVARFDGDDAWPGPIWGALPTRPYEESELAEAADFWRQALSAIDGFTPVA